MHAPVRVAVMARARIRGNGSNRAPALGSGPREAPERVAETLAARDQLGRLAFALAHVRQPSG